MAGKDNLKELRDQKILLRHEINNIEDILTFKSKKKSLGVLTSGLTDRFLKETISKNGETKLSLDAKGIMSGISDEIKEVATRKNMIGFANDSVNSRLLEDTIRLGAATFIGNYAEKNMKHKSWKKKIIGIALIYVAPYALKMVREKLDNYQKEKTTSSLEKLI